MNSETGQISERPLTQGEAQKLGYDVPLTPGEADILQDVPPERRMEAMKLWKEYAEEEIGSVPVSVKIKAKYAFLTGFAAACN